MFEHHPNYVEVDTPWWSAEWVRENPEKSCPAPATPTGRSMTAVDITEEGAEFHVDGK